MTSEAMSIVVDINEVSDVVAQAESLSESSSTSTQGENIYEELKKAAQVGDIERLYELIAEDPNILGHFDKVPFCETPLHVAAEKGQTGFAMELMTLKPSLALKLNMSGFSAMHLALQNNHTRMVRGFVAIDSSLVSIKGRGRITPLHHVARIGDTELLSEFLFACPSSVNDLTIKCETAVHIAVKNHQFMAFKVLLGWLNRVNRKELLDWKDIDGNTALHIAASTFRSENGITEDQAKYQIKILKLLRSTVKREAKNFDGKTAEDLLQPRQPPSEYSTTTLAGYLSQKLSFIEKRNNLLGVSNLSMTRDMSLNTNDRSGAILVMAILIVTATYQTAMSPPGGFWQDTSHSPDAPHRAGQMIMSFSSAFSFVGLNGFAFLASLYVIIIIIIGHPEWKLIYVSTGVLSMAVFASYGTTLPSSSGKAWIVRIFLGSYPLIIVTMMFAAYMAFRVDQWRRHRVDFPASCFNSSQELSG